MGAIDYKLLGSPEDSPEQNAGSGTALSNMATTTHVSYLNLEIKMKQNTKLSSVTLATFQVANGYCIRQSRVGIFHHRRKLSNRQHSSRESLNLDSLVSAGTAMHGGKMELEVRRPVETQISHLSNVRFWTHY